jgi:altronate dehydratase
MKKLLFASGIAALLILGGCQQFQDTAENLRKEGEKTVNGLSQQADNIKTQVLETKAAYDEKSQQVVNAVDAVNKVMK